MATHILLIEDEMQIRENVAELLTLKGFEVSAATNGVNGVTQALLKQPDLILCDIMMPEMDGYQVLETIRQNRSLSTMPFIFLTAKADSTDFRRGMTLGADDYLTKPFTIDSLLTAIEGRLQREQQRKADLQERLTRHRRTIDSVSAHEYNTPLSGILGFVNLLIDYYDDFSETEVRSMLVMVREGGLRLKRSLDNVRLTDLLQNLDPAHPFYQPFTTGKTQMHADRIGSLLTMAGSRQDRAVTGLTDVETAAVGMSDENLTTVLTELLDNAAKFSDGTEPISVTGRCEQTAYRLSITNHGRLFRPEDIARIAPYQQFDRHLYEQQGMGLGLAIARKLVDLHRGSLTIESHTSGQTVVTVRIPYAAASELVAA